MASKERSNETLALSAAHQRNYSGQLMFRSALLPWYVLSSPLVYVDVPSNIYLAWSHA